MEEKYFGCAPSQFSCQGTLLSEWAPTAGLFWDSHLAQHSSDWDHNCPPRAEWSLKIICFDRILCIHGAGKIVWSRKNINCWYIVWKMILCAHLFSICDGLKWLQKWSRKMERLNENMRSNTGWSEAVQHQQCTIGNIEGPGRHSFQELKQTILWRPSCLVQEERVLDIWIHIAHLLIPKNGLWSYQD